MAGVEESRRPQSHRRSGGLAKRIVRCHLFRAVFRQSAGETM